MVDPLSYFSFQPVLHDWCNKGRGMCYPFCGMVYIKEPLLLIRKSSPCGSSTFPLLPSEWSFTICLMPYNRKIKCVELNKTFFLNLVCFDKITVLLFTLYRWIFWGNHISLGSLSDIVFSWRLPRNWKSDCTPQVHWLRTWGVEWPPLVVAQSNGNMHWVRGDQSNWFLKIENVLYASSYICIYTLFHENNMGMYCHFIHFLFNNFII